MNEMKHTFGHAKIEAIIHFLNFLSLDHTLQLVPEFS